MSRLLLLFFFASMSSVADIGDVYYCKTLKDIRTEKDGTLTSYDTVAFNFKEREDVIDFGSTYLIDTTLPYKITDRIGDDIHAEHRFARAYFSGYGNVGELFFSTAHPSYLRSFVADCEKFESPQK